MTTLVPDPIHLHRIDLDRNMRRFYELSVQPTLFGGASLVRTWGRIGTAGQSRIETFDHPSDTAAAFSCLERTKRRRGYHDTTRAALP